MRSLKRGEPGEVEDTLSPHRAEAQVTRATARQVETVLAVSHITERKAAEEAQRESEREFHLLAEAMPQIVWVCEPDGKKYLL